LNLKREIGAIPGSAIRLALVSMLICGLLFPLAVTGVAQLFLGDPANGSMAHFGNGTIIGSHLIAQDFTRPYFFHSRNSTLSASGVDPDITLQDALNQVPRISNATGISQSNLTSLVNQRVEGTLWLFGYPYVNVLGLNLALIQNFQPFYCSKGYCE
jgi:K+-transporting ATPase ATPase C chain